MKSWERESVDYNGIIAKLKTVLPLCHGSQITSFHAIAYSHQTVHIYCIYDSEMHIHIMNNCHCCESSLHGQKELKLSSFWVLQKKYVVQFGTAWGIHCCCFSVWFKVNLPNTAVCPWIGQWLNHMASVQKTLLLMWGENSLMVYRCRSL